MNILDTFGQFYNSLDIVGLVIFWLAFFAFLVLLGSVINLYKKNKQLVFIIDDLRKKLNETIKEEQEKKIKEKKEQVIVEKKEEVKEEKVNNNVEKVEVTVVKEPMKKEEKKGEGPYSKNVLRENTARYQTSPISIKKSETKDEINIASISREEMPQVKEEKNSKKEEKLSFAEEISKKMEEELKPQTIELTDYEKKQEEEAVISYQELLKTNKDRLYNITDEEETIDFIKELKSFRSSL